MRWLFVSFLKASGYSFLRVFLIYDLTAITKDFGDLVSQFSLIELQPWALIWLVTKCIGCLGLQSNLMAVQSKPVPLPPWGNALAGATGAVLANAMVYPLDM